MQTTAAKSDKVTSTIKAIGAGIFLCIPVLWVLGIVTAEDHPVPFELRGCYKNGQQTLQVESKRIIVNRRSTPEIAIKYMVTNAGRQIETANGSSFQLNQAKPPYKQVGRNMIISVQDNTLVAFTSNGEAIPFRRATAPATCGSVGNRR
jgi:hypothetical protein